MKSSIILSASLIMLLLPAFTCAQETSEIVDRALEAVGGKWAVSAIKSVHATLVGEMAGSEIKYEVWSDTPGRLRIHLHWQGAEVHLGSDGTEFWLIRNGERIDETDIIESMKKQIYPIANMFLCAGLLNINKLGIETEYVGTETLGSAMVDVISFASTKESANLNGRWYLDNTGRMLQARIDIPDIGEMTVDMSDHKPFNKLTLPARMDVSSAQGNFYLEIMELEINPKLKPDLFEPR